MPYLYSSREDDRRNRNRKNARDNKISDRTMVEVELEEHLDFKAKILLGICL